MPTSYKGLTVPLPSDIADGPTDFTQYTDSLPFQVFATVAARDAWTNPPNGAMCVTADTYTRWIRRGGVWSALSPVVQWVVLTGGGISSATPVTLGTVTVPSAPYPRYVRLSGMCIFTGNAGGHYQLAITMGASSFFARGLGDGWSTATIPPVELALAANTVGTVTATGALVGGTAGTATMSNDPRYNRLDVVSRGY